MLKYLNKRVWQFKSEMSSKEITTLSRISLVPINTNKMGVHSWGHLVNKTSRDIGSIKVKEKQLLPTSDSSISSYKE